MKKEDVGKIKCDRCGVVVGLYRHESGLRCPECIWKERENLISSAINLIDASEHDKCGHGYKKTVFATDLSDLKDAVDEAIK